MMSGSAAIEPHELQAAPPLQAAGIGLWVFIGVACALFTLFVAAYIMRMGSSDWSPIALPWQLWLSTGWLVAGSLVMQAAAGAASVAAIRTGVASHAQRQRARLLLAAGGACALLFLASQWWAWNALAAARVAWNGNAAASFFYLLTALHGLHVIGGLVAWSIAWRALAHSAHSAGSAIDHAARLVHLCARYWHFLFGIWLLLFSTLAGVTPDIVRRLCGIA
jgi:cytochrome c oxidase subunit 3